MSLRGCRVDNEYIFKNVKTNIKYVGDFEGLYKNVKDPWGQLTDKYYKRRSYAIIDALKEIKPRSVLDVGCGLGQVTQLIHILITHDVCGVDISEEAVKRANKKFPEVNFGVLNILEDELPQRYDAIVLSGVLWYVLEDLDGVMEKMNNGLNYLGHLVMFQTFLKDQKYGKDIIDGYHGWIKYLDNLSGYRIINSAYCDTNERRKDGIVVLQKWGEE